MTLPTEGEARDYTTPQFFLNKAVKYMPLGILSIAANIAQKQEVKIFDPASFGFSIEQCLEEIAIYKPDVLGISAVTVRAYAMAEILKRADCPIKVVGGPHATHYANEIIALGAHAVFVGDGDRNFVYWLEGGM